MKYAEDGYLYFPPLVVGGPSGDYEAKCPVDSCEEAEFCVLAIASQDSGTPRLLITGDSQPAMQIKFDGTVSLGLRSGSDQGTLTYPGLLMSQTGTQAWNPPESEYFPIIDSQKRVFVRVDVAVSQALFVTLRYRVKPVRRVVGHVTTVHPDNEVQHNLERERRTIAHLNSETIKGRGEAINL